MTMSETKDKRRAAINRLKRSAKQVTAGEVHAGDLYLQPDGAAYGVDSTGYHVDETGQRLCASVLQVRRIGRDALPVGQSLRDAVQMVLHEDEPATVIRGGLYTLQGTSIEQERERKIALLNAAWDGSPISLPDYPASSEEPKQ
jgi:hypothetical protein